MRDKDNLLRGACSVCTACVEYCFRRDSNRCEDCGCLVTRHDVLPDGADDPLAALPMSPRSLRSQSPAAAQAVALLPKAYAGGYNSYPWSNPATFYAQLPQSHYMPGFDAGMQLLESQKNAAAVASAAAKAAVSAVEARAQAPASNASEDLQDEAAKPKKSVRHRGAKGGKSKQQRKSRRNQSDSDQDNEEDEREEEDEDANNDDDDEESERASAKKRKSKKPQRGVSGMMKEAFYQVTHPEEDDDDEFVHANEDADEKGIVNYILGKELADILKAYSGVTFVFGNYIVWCILAASIIRFGGNISPNATSEDWEFSRHFYRATFFLFLIGFIFSGLSYRSASNQEKKLLSMNLMCVTGLCSLCYWASSSRAIKENFLDPVGRPVEILRYMEWFFSCPVLIYLIGKLTKTRHNYWITIACDYGVILTGYLAVASRGIGLEFLIFSAASFGFFYIVILRLWQYYTTAIKRVRRRELRKDGAENDADTPEVGSATLALLRLQSCIAWTLFPVIWTLGMAGITSLGVTNALYCGADVLAKLVFTLVLVNCNLEQSQNQKVAKVALVTRALDNKVKHSDKLLTSMMPETVLQALKDGKAKDVEEFESVTVFFSDICQFTVLSQRTAPPDMMKTLEKLWIEYDKVAKKHKMYKVETIGDAFLGVTGCPDRVDDHAERAARFSLDIMEMIKNFKTTTGESIRIRIGLASGPVTAGIMGEINPHWCIVGDTVSVAHKMESSSEPTRILISKSTYELLRPTRKYLCENAKNVDVEGVGSVETFFLNSAR